ncbi:MAG TPA: MFS transporter [Candidatus Baltobacteraceae bacterium]|jgi:EmrB/QacA subfamily drug resistance transporter|nr:MFS transporter [Candidatus Baltobacteraceae bacterium]
MSSSRARIANFGMYLAGFMAVVNISVIYLALPYIERSLHAGIADQEWILSIYPLMEGGFTLAAGTLGDLYGRKRILTVTTWLFVLATLACALAPSAPVLIVLRGLQGLGGAALLSLPVAILVQMLPAGVSNEDTIRRFSTVAGSGAVAGPVLGGMLVHFWGWPAVFYLSVVMGLAMLATLPFVTESERDPSMRLDGIGQFLSILSFLAISFALIEGNAQGWNSPVILIACAVFIAGLAAFIMVERSAPKPMIHLRYFSSRPFLAALLVIGVINFGWYGVMLLCTGFLQQVQHQSPFAAGFYLMPSNLAFFIVNQYSEAAEKALGARLLLIVSWVIGLGGIVWLAMLGSSAASWQVAAGLFIAGVGWGLLFTPAASMAMSACAGADQGFASGAVALSRSIFGVFGIAILGTLLAGGMARGIASGLAAINVPARAVRLIVKAVHHGGAFTVAQHPPAGVSSAVLTKLVEQSFVQGWHAALLVCAIITAAFGVLIYVLLPARRTARAPSSA